MRTSTISLRRAPNKNVGPNALQRAGSTDACCCSFFEPLVISTLPDDFLNEALVLEPV